MTNVATVLMRVLREGAWLTRERVRGYSIMLVGFSLAVIIWLLCGHGANDPLGRPVGTDFLQFWTGSWAVLHGQVDAIYSLRAFSALEHQVFPYRGAPGTVYAWLYPPTLLPIVAPLALLPYLPALLVWLTVGLGAYLAALWRILPSRLTLLAALAFPAVLLTIEHGQTSVIVVPLLTWGLLLLPQRPILAGVLLGLLAFKPQLVLLLPIALVLGGQWRTLLAATVTLAASIALSIALFGLHSWVNFFAIAPLARQILEYGELSPFYKMQSVFSALRLLGASVWFAYFAQFLVAALAAVCVAWSWRQQAGQGLKNAVLCAAIPLATPYFMDYDLLVLAPAIAWLASAAIQGGFRPWERTALAAAFAAPLLARFMGQMTHIELTPLAAGGLVAVLVLRIRGEEAQVKPSR